MNESGHKHAYAVIRLPGAKPLLRCLTCARVIR